MPRACGVDMISVVSPVPPPCLPSASNSPVWAFATRTIAPPTPLPMIFASRDTTRIITRVVTA